MNKNDTIVWVAIIAAIAAITIMTTAFIVVGRVSVARAPLPACEEDQVIVGAGDYEDGRWDAYVCVARDDL